KNCVPSPHGIKAVWKATPSMVPLTLTDLVEPKNVTDSGHTTHAQPSRSSMVALNVLLIGVICPMSRLLSRHQPEENFSYLALFLYRTCPVCYWQAACKPPDGYWWRS